MGSSRLLQNRTPSFHASSESLGIRARAGRLTQRKLLKVGPKRPPRNRCCESAPGSSHQIPPSGVTLREPPQCRVGFASANSGFTKVSKSLLQIIAVGTCRRREAQEQLGRCN